MENFNIKIYEKLIDKLPYKKSRVKFNAFTRRNGLVVFAPRKSVNVTCVVMVCYIWHILLHNILTKYFTCFFIGQLVKKM